MPIADLPRRTDILVIGAGIAGASAAAELAGRAEVVLVEGESQPGYHTTGRSAAFYAESYGGPAIRPLTSASKAFLEHPPAGFSDVPLITPRGCLHLFAAVDRELAEKRASGLAACLSGIRLVEQEELLSRLPMLRREMVAGAIDDPECRDLDVAAIHQGYLRAFRRQGGRPITDARVTALARLSGGWRVTTTAGTIMADAVINAAGAWVDALAALAGLAPFGFMPLRRTIVVFEPRDLAVDAEWPLALDFHERFYFKPESGHILASPADETPSPPCDARPEEIDVARALDRIEKATTLRVERIVNRWAGLRTFAPDRIPVVGPDPRAPGFFWCAGQGGYGIQTAPAMARLTAATVLGRPLPDDLAAHGVSAATYAPARFL
ncbi:MAG: NAD(P)/FAD-dependent oxidoreductase [Rhodothalassiaceae bacterium]